MLVGSLNPDKEFKIALSSPFPVKGGSLRCISVSPGGTQCVHSANDGICSVKDVSSHSYTIKPHCRLLFSLVNHVFFTLAFGGFSCLEEAHYLRRAERGPGLGSGKRRLEAGL